MQKLWFISFRFLVKLAIKLFYRRIEIHGTFNLPKSGPVLLAPNHQNAFMDALIPAVFAGRPIHFLVRADVFKPGLADKILRSFNMMPVYRQRDGLENLAKNEEVFEQCHQILRNGGVLLIFPEAGHLGKRRLRNLSKGFTRIVFGATEGNESLGIQIVPVGINYSNYYQSQSRLILNWGEPISVSDYLEEHAEHPSRAMTQLRLYVQEKLKDQVVHIEREDALKAFDIEMERILPFFLERTSGFTMPTRQHDFYKEREASIQKIPEGDTYFTRLNIYDLEMEKHRLRAPFFFIFGKDAGYWFIQNIFLILFLPVFLFSWLLHTPTYFLIRTVLKKYVRDPQFHSSIKLVGNLFLFPVVCLVLTLIAILMTHRPLLVLGVSAIVFPASIFVIRELRLPYRYVLTLWRSLWLKFKKPDLFKYLKEIEQAILNSATRR